jgi:DNA-binding PadR family transcriptional regulator
LLALLTEGPKYGLQLRQEFEARTGEVWPLNVGQVYTTLQRLERDGLVTSDDPEGEGPQKGFRITAAGGGELDRWLRAPPDAVPPPRDELVIKVLVALRMPGVDVHELIQVHRRHLVEQMQQYTRLKAEAPERDVGLALVVDAEVFRLEAVVRWLDWPGRGRRRAAAAGRQIGGSAVSALLELRQVSKVSGSGSTEVRALHEVDLSVDGGELVAVMLLALGILAMTVGLIRGEAAGDLRTLTATGATGTTRRNLAAVTAGHRPATARGTFAAAGGFWQTLWQSCAMPSGGPARRRAHRPPAVPGASRATRPPCRGARLARRRACRPRRSRPFSPVAGGARAPQTAQ